MSFGIAPHNGLGDEFVETAFSQFAQIVSCMTSEEVKYVK